MVHRPKVFRPHLDDVERLSYGKGAKKQRGTGSRFTCHRLNQHERTLFELAKKQQSSSSFSYLTLKGSGYRKNRKGSPLCNIYRQRCDALEELCVMVEKRSDLDRVVIDFSTLRVRNDAMFRMLILENVFQAKYPDLYHLIMNEKGSDGDGDGDGDDDGDDDVDGDDDGVSLNLIHKPINWEAVKIKPIWDVDERLITVSCERDVAKSVAMDVMRESSKFTFDDPSVWEECINELDENINIDHDNDNNNTSDFEIDLDDI